MDEIERLKTLERTARPGPWRVCRSSSCDRSETHGIDDARGGLIIPTLNVPRVEFDLIVAMRNLAPELLALWEALYNDAYGFGNAGSEIDDAFDALNDKAKEVLK